LSTPEISKILSLRAAGRQPYREPTARSDFEMFQNELIGGREETGLGARRGNTEARIHNSGKMMPCGDHSVPWRLSTTGHPQDDVHQQRLGIRGLQGSSEKLGSVLARRLCLCLCLCHCRCHCHGQPTTERRPPTGNHPAPSSTIQHPEI
jgi:hypothetical protein